MRGVVTFFKPDKGWGAIASPQLPPGEDAFVHFSEIRATAALPTGFRLLEAGDVVEFDAEPAAQDSFRWVAEHVVRIAGGPAPTLRRRGDRVVVEAPGTPDTPLTPKGARG